MANLAIMKVLKKAMDLIDKIINLEKIKKINLDG